MNIKAVKYFQTNSKAFNAQLFLLNVQGDVDSTVSADNFTSEQYQNQTEQNKARRVIFSYPNYRKVDSTKINFYMFLETIL